MDGKLTRTCDRQRLGQRAEVSAVQSAAAGDGPWTPGPRSPWTLGARSGRSRGAGSPVGRATRQPIRQSHTRFSRETHTGIRTPKSPDSFLLMINGFYFKNENIKRKTVLKLKKAFKNPCSVFKIQLVSLYSQRQSKRPLSSAFQWLLIASAFLHSFSFLHMTHSLLVS